MKKPSVPPPAPVAQYRHRGPFSTRGASSGFTAHTIHATLILGVIGVLVVIVYGFFVALPYLKGPILTVEQPRESPEHSLIISGTTERVSTVHINGLEVPLTQEGTFAVERAYPPGYTVVEITATDRFGRSKEKTLTFITEQNYASKKENNEESSTEENREQESGDQINQGNERGETSGEGSGEETAS
ncbi:MAG: hypothetical protein ACJKTH_00460 [Patescibacteria group bacterium UBA2163]